MKFLVTGLLVLISSLNVYAAETAAANTTETSEREPAATKPAPVQPVVVAPTNSAPTEYTRESRGTSATNREGKSFMLVAQPIGLGPITFINQGLGAGLYLNPDSILQLEFKGNSDNDYEGDNYDTKIRSLGVNWKQFLGNSFYLKGGIEHRWVTASSDYRGSFGTTGWAWGFKGQSTSAAIAIGNQWQFSGFTLGCDWFGVQQPLIHTRSNEYAIDNDDYAQRRLNEESENYLEDTTYSFVHFYLGMSF